MSAAAFKAIAAAALLAVLVFGWNWFLAHERGIGYNKAMAEVAERENAALMAALAETERLNKLVEEANAKAQQETAKNAELTARNSALLVRLRNSQSAIDAAVSGATREALADATRSINALFGECRDAFETVGRAAAGHLADAHKLDHAWPK